MISPPSLKMFYLGTNKVLKAWKVSLVPSAHCVRIGDYFFLGFLPSLQERDEHRESESHLYLSCGVGE